MTGLLDALRAEGCDVAPVAGWTSRTRPGTFRPSIVVPHWTASRATDARPAPSLDLVTNGLPGLGGPLYHLLVDRTGRVHVVSRGVCNHAGLGSTAVRTQAGRGIWLPRPPGRGAGDAVQNVHGWAVSADYHPDTGPMPAAQRDGMVLACTALHRWHGWPQVRMADHWMLTSRKRDLDTIDLRLGVLARLTADRPPEEDDLMLTLIHVQGDSDTARRYALCVATGYLEHMPSQPFIDLLVDTGQMKAGPSKRYTRPTLEILMPTRVGHIRTVVRLTS